MILVPQSKQIFFIKSTDYLSQLIWIYHVVGSASTLFYD